MKFSLVLALSYAGALSSARFIPVRRASFTVSNGQDAISLNQKFASLTPDSACTAGENACVQGQFAQCVNGKFVLQPCGTGTVCAALPLVNSAGTSVTCTTAADRDARIAATGASSGSSSSGAAPANDAGKGGAAGNNAAASAKAAAPAASAKAAAAPAASNSSDTQQSLTLDPKVLAKGFENNGQDQPEAGQVASLTSSNNFINFCATSNLPITNGQQVKTGSCNPAPMGIIAATTNMPSAKFIFPKNGGEVEANKDFTVQLAVNNLDTGFFTNAQETYFAAPQQVNSANGNVQGHSHVVIEKLNSMDQTTPTNPGTFAFFKGLNEAAQGGVLTADITSGLDEGVYRIASINTAANHQPVLVAVAQHGSLDDMVYFTVKKGANSNSTASAAAAPAKATAAAAKAKSGKN